MSLSYPVRRIACLLAAAALAVAMGTGCTKPVELSPVEVSLKLDKDPAFYEKGDVAFAAISLRNVNQADYAAAPLTTGAVKIYCSRVDMESGVKSAAQVPVFSDAPTMADGALTLAPGGVEQANWEVTNLPAEPGSYVLYVKYKNAARNGELSLSNQVAVTIE